MGSTATVENGGVIIERPYDKTNKVDRMAFLDLQHRRGKQSCVVPKSIGFLKHNGMLVLIASTVTESRDIIENDLIVIDG